MHSISTFEVRSFLLTLFFLLSACAPTRPPVLEEYRDGVLFTKNLIDRCGKLDQPEQLEYLLYLQSRLAATISKHRKDAPPVRFIMIGCDEPMAYAPGGGIVLFSKGLVRALGTESELAFVLAHELAHDHLGHLAKMNDPDSMGEDRPALERALELDADRYATGIVALSGYDPRSAFIAIQRLYGAGFYEIGSVTHPSKQERSEIIRSRILEAQWSPPGTIDRREFQRFRRELAQAR